jgi:hypothetical protein
MEWLLIELYSYATSVPFLQGIQDKFDLGFWDMIFIKRESNCLIIHCKSNVEYKSNSILFSISGFQLHAFMKIYESAIFLHEWYV